MTYLEFYYDFPQEIDKHPIKMFHNVEVELRMRLKNMLITDEFSCALNNKYLFKRFI
jgi:hypothetical protein